LNLDPVGGSISPERGVNITGISRQVRKPKKNLMKMGF
jgi:hypothetical protein